MPLFHDMFYLALPVAEKILRPILVYIFLIIGLRLAGKRSLASLNAFDLVVLLCISNTVQNAIIGNDTSVSGGMIGAATLLCVNYAAVRFFFAHPKLDRIIEGQPTLLINKGKMVKSNLNRELISKEELMTAVHKQGFRSVDEIERGELEPGGAIALIAKSPTEEDVRSLELAEKLDALSAQMDKIQESLARMHGRAQKPAAEDQPTSPGSEDVV
ncbi:MAG: DUF421 domain-containing protein [Acidobacteria bacterium]|nr:DUF421 domain-containing protein [Acidobacteriota bacterium]